MGREADQTNKRNLKLDDYGISNKKYKELCGFCEQYPEWVDELKYNKSILKSKVITDMPLAHNPNANPQEDLAIRRAELQSKVDLIDRIAHKADPDLADYIIKNVCYERPIWYLTDIMDMPSSERAFRDRKRYFFYLLSKEKKM